jgi:hypothetical protein
MTAPKMVLQLPVTPDAAALTLTGFAHFWGWYVTGFNPARHCQASLLGRRSVRIGKAMTVGVDVALDEVERFDYFYLCGVSRPHNWDWNFHLAVKPNCGAEAEDVTHAGQRIVISNAERIHIAPLPAGFNGRDPRFTTCRNYQFAVAMYQFGPCGEPLVANVDGTYGARPLRRRRSSVDTPVQLAAQEGTNNDRRR